MFVEHELLVMGVAVLVQLIGVLGVVVARISQRRNAGRVSLLLATCCFVFVGFLSLLTMETCGSGWLAFATTLPLMAVGATWDGKHSAASAAY
jgi:hypothetical protein